MTDASNTPDESLPKRIAGQESQEQQKLGEWRTYHVDGYCFSIRRTASGELEVQREELDQGGVE